MNKGLFLFFCMIFVMAFGFAQQNIVKANTSKVFIPSYLYPNLWSDPKKTPRVVVPSNFYVKNMGFFCKQELKLQAATNLPLKFRLGSVQYCDKMEGKLNTAY